MSPPIPAIPLRFRSCRPHWLLARKRFNDLLRHTTRRHRPHYPSPTSICPGYNSTLKSSPSSARPVSVVDTIGSSSAIAPQSSPPPRYRLALVPNMNNTSSPFVNQVFVVSGLYNTSLRNDGGTINGEEIVMCVLAGPFSHMRCRPLVGAQ